VESVIARQRRPLIASAEFLEADGAFSLVLQNFALGVVDLARWERQKIAASFAVFPISRILVAVACVLVRAKAMAFVSLPLSSMSISVGPLVGAVAMPFVIFPFSDVHISVGALVGAVAMRFVIFPFSDVHISVVPLVGAVAMRFVFFPFSDVHISVGALEGAVAMTFVIFPLSGVHISVGVLVGAVAMRFVFFPFSDVHISVGALEGAVTMPFVIFPLSGVHIFVGPRLGAVAMRFVFFPFSYVHTVAMTFAILPLSDVLISVGPRVGAVTMMFVIFPISDVLISVDVLEAALAFGVEGAEEQAQAQEHRYKRDPIGEINYDASESDSCCICNESDSGPLVGTLAVGKVHCYKRFMKYTRSGEERKFMTQLDLVIFFLECIVLQSVFSPAPWARSVNCTSTR
jgi:hypothetical protein